MPLTGDEKLVQLPAASDATMPARQKTSTQQTLAQLQGNSEPRLKTKARRASTGGAKQPIGHVKFARPLTPTHTTASKTTKISPAKCLRMEIAKCASPKATVLAGTQESPYALTKSDRPGLQLISGDIHVMQKGLRNTSARLRLFGATTQQKYIESIGAKIQWDSRKFVSFQRKERLTNVATITTETLKITLDSIRAHEAKPRTTKQDDVMNHTAISHMEARNLRYEKKIEWQWGHLISYTLNGEDPPAPSNLMVVSPSANMLESRITAGLKKAMETFSITAVPGHWELTITANRVQITDNSGQTAYLPHVSNYQEYEYVYVHPNGQRTDSIIIIINPLDPNQISYEKHTDVFANLFGAIMRGKNLFESMQKKLYFSTYDAAAADNTENMTSMETGLTAPSLVASAIPAEADTAAVVTVAQPAVAARPRREKRKFDDDQPSSHTRTIPRLNMDHNTLKQLVSEQTQRITEFVIITAEEFAKTDDDSTSNPVNAIIFQEALENPHIIFSSPGNYPTLSFNVDINDPSEISPIFVFEREDGQDDVVIFKKGFCPEEIFDAIDAAIEIAKQQDQLRAERNAQRRRPAAETIAPAATVALAVTVAERQPPAAQTNVQEAQPQYAAATAEPAETSTPMVTDDPIAINQPAEPVARLLPQTLFFGKNGVDIENYIPAALDATPLPDMESFDSHSVTIIPVHRSTTLTR